MELPKYTMHLPLDLQEHILGHTIPYFPINPHQLLWPGPTGHCTVKQATNFCLSVRVWNQMQLTGIGFG